MIVNGHFAALFSKNSLNTFQWVDVIKFETKRAKRFVRAHCMS